MVKFDSISFFLEDQYIQDSVSLIQFLEHSFELYKVYPLDREKERLLPRAWEMPEIFRKKIQAASGHQLNEVNIMIQLCESIRYNFSSGEQVSAQEILRHPLGRQVPLEYLPQLYTKIEKNPLRPYIPIIYNAFRLRGQFRSQAFIEVDEIIQDLLHRLIQLQQKQKVEIYIQTYLKPSLAVKAEALDFEINDYFDWRVIVTSHPEYKVEFKLINVLKEESAYFNSFVLIHPTKKIIFHAWKKEFSNLQDFFIQNNIVYQSRLQSHSPQQLSHFELSSELSAKKTIRHLRQRSIAVKLQGELTTLAPDRYVTEIHLGENTIEVCNQGRNEKSVYRRKGFSEVVEVIKGTLSEGVGFFLQAQAKDLASSQPSRREWDLKILKHTGIIQYITFECLYLLLEEELSDGRSSTQQTLLQDISSNIQSILIQGPGSSFVQDRNLNELCSKAILIYFQKWIDFIFNHFDEDDSAFTENGEVIFQKLIQKEYRLFLALFEKMVFESQGEIFKRARSSFVDQLRQQEHNPTDLLNTLHPLQAEGFKLFFKGQPLQDLTEDQIQIDFVLESLWAENQNFNWFELNPHFFLNGQSIDPEKFLTSRTGGMIEYQGKVYILPTKYIPSLRRLQHFWSRIQNKSESKSKNKKISDKVYQIPRNQTLELLALRASGIQIRGDEEWKKLCEFYDRLGLQRPGLDLPSGIKAEMKPYQLAGVQWLLDLYNLRLGALLADDMGLGKTLQTLAFLEILRSKEDLGPVLIVVPSSLVFNWEVEIKKFTPELPYLIFNSKNMDEAGRRAASGESFLLITTYGLLLEHDQYFDQYKWKIIIFDEAQNLKNITTKRTTAARSLNAQFKICLTGTPMENHYGEFYSLMDILVPGSLGRLEDFRRQFVNTNVITVEQMQDLKLKIKPLLLRRTKKEILSELPDKIENKVSIAFEDTQKEIYRDIAVSYNQQIQEALSQQQEERDRKQSAGHPATTPSAAQLQASQPLIELNEPITTAHVQLQMLTALMRLRQVCSDPAAVPHVQYDKVPPKVSALVESLEEIISSGESVLVFTQFIPTLHRIEKILTEMNIPHFTLHGGVSSKQRQVILSNFQSYPKGAVMLMTLKTGGVGLNLTKASYVFHIEPWWNPAVENQATDRAHRLGQEKSVQVFKYIMHESLEEKIEILKERKGQKFNVLLSLESEEGQVGSTMASSQNAFIATTTKGSGLSKEDFEFLISNRN